MDREMDRESAAPEAKPVWVAIMSGREVRTLSSRRSRLDV
jgi:hypothetical protein